MTKSQLMEMDLRIAIDQLNETISRLQVENQQHIKDKQELRDQLDKSNRHCEILKCEMVFKQSLIDKSDKEKKDILDAWSNAKPTVNIGGQVMLNKKERGEIDITPMQVSSPEETLQEGHRLKEVPENPTVTIATPPAKDSFVNRLKAIIRKASAKNGQTITSKAKGHISSYSYYINATCFCRAVDEMLQKESKYLSDFLGGDLNNVQLNKVGVFIGETIRMNIINASTLQITDIVFAFADYYPNASSVRSRLSEKYLPPEMKLLLGIFSGLLKKHAC